MENIHDEFLLHGTDVNNCHHNNRARYATKYFAGEQTQSYV